MTFTESDAANDGLIKREVGKQMAKVAKTQNPQLFEHFENVADEIGRAPADIFGEMAVRALNSENYADQIFNSEVSMKKIRADEIRLEDVKYVKQLSEELGLNDKDETSDPIDELINQRISNVSQSPLENMRKSKEDPSGVNGQVLEHMESLQGEINEMKQKIDDGESGNTASSGSSEHNEQSVDSLFGDSDEEEQTEDEGEQVTGDVVEVEPEPEPEPVMDEAEAEEEGPTEEQIEEAMEGTVASVDEEGADEEPDELDSSIDIPSEETEEETFVTSEDGEEE